MQEFSKQQKKELLELARKSINYFLHTRQYPNYFTKNKKFLEKKGAFITIYSLPEKQLRGCIGFSEPIMPLWSIIIEASILAAFEDNRFPQLQFKELENTLIEISILTKPVELNKEKLLEEIEIGKTGLIIERERKKGLLLPKVAIEWNWSKQEFLENTCQKAGLNKNSWKEKETRIFKFEAIVFSEKN